MRLINIHDLSLTEFIADVPPYVSTAARICYVRAHPGDRVHGGSDCETAGNSIAPLDGLGSYLQRIVKRKNTTSPGYEKIRQFCGFIIACREPQVHWAWVDTCCIDKRSSAELSEAINSMWKWYMQAQYCVAYLADLEKDSDAKRGLRRDEFVERLSSSDWFNRGW